MKEYVKIALYAYPFLKTVEEDYERHIRNRAVLSYDSRRTAEDLAEYLAGEILEMRRLEWLKATLEEVLLGLDEEERVLVGLRYFGRTKEERRLEKGASPWTERTYFRRQRRLGEKLCGRLRLAGLSEEVFLRDFAGMELFAKLRRYVEAGKDKKISAKERRWLRGE